MRQVLQYCLFTCLNYIVFMRVFKNLTNSILKDPSFIFNFFQEMGFWAMKISNTNRSCYVTNSVEWLWLFISPVGIILEKTIQQIHTSIVSLITITKHIKYFIKTFCKKMKYWNDSVGLCVKPWQNWQPVKVKPSSFLQFFSLYVVTVLLCSSVSGS